MGKASSSKKVARAAKAGGSLRERPKLGYPLAVFVIVILGTALVAYARADRLEARASTTEPVKDKDHWHTAYGIYVCDHFLPPLTDLPGRADPDGLHTHGDGIMHVHPFSARGSGTNARLKIWGEMVGMKFGKDFIDLNGTKYFNGYKCGDKDAKVLVYRWAAPFDESSAAEVFDKDFGEIRYKSDRSALTIAVVPEGTDVPRPDSIPQLDQLTDVQGAGDPAEATPPISGLDPTQTITVPSSIPGDASITTLPGAVSSTLPGDVSITTLPGAVSSTTPAPGDVSSTTAAP